MSSFWIWLFAILSGTASLVGIFWFSLWLIERSKLKRKKKKPGKKRIPERFYAVAGFWVAIVSVVMALIFAIWGIIKGEIEMKEFKSDISQLERLMPSRVDTVTREIQGEKEPKDTIQDSDSSALRTRDPKLDSTCAVVYLEGDSTSEREAQELKNFLLSDARKSRFQEYPFRYYPLVKKDTHWFKANNLLAKGRNEKNLVAHVYFSDSTTGWLARRIYYAAMEGLTGVVFKEKYSGHQYTQDETNKGNGVLKDFLITDFGCEGLDKTDEKLSGYDFVIIIPPYHLNIYTLDSIMESLHPPQE